MKKLVFAMLIAAFILAGCVMVRGPRGRGVVMVPALPAIVVLGADPYYYQSGFYYYYHNGVWFYSNARRGPWAELPRDRWPREVRHEDRGRGRERGRGWKRGHDREDY